MRPDRLALAAPLDQHAHPDQLLHHDQQQAEVVRPQQRSRGEDVRRPVAHARVADRPQLRPQGEQPEQLHEGVHPGFLRVPDQQRRGGAEGGRDQAGAAVVELAPEQVERGDRERAGDDRRDPHRQLAVAERLHGQPQHHVVQRRMAIAVLQVLEQVVEAQVRLVDADRLVEPDPARDRQAQRQPGCGDRGQDRQRDFARWCPARRAVAPSRAGRTGRPRGHPGAGATACATNSHPGASPFARGATLPRLG